MITGTPSIVAFDIWMQRTIEAAFAGRKARKSSTSWVDANALPFDPTMDY
jgi:hypothetical protein